MPTYNFHLPGFYPPNAPNVPFMQERVPTGLNPRPTLYPNDWGIFNPKTGDPVFVVDTCVSLENKETTKVSTFPVENGAFASYNKVVEPTRPKVRLAVGGQQAISNLLDQLAVAVRSLELYDVVVPEHYYLNMCLESYDYKRSNKTGQNMLEVDLTLVEIRQVATATTTVKIASPKKATAATKKPTGNEQPKPPDSPVERGMNDGFDQSRRIFGFGR